ncbi:MAG: hypothetical protein MK554_16820 [Planctomycetes bacterium]|nr:hypothetical protein [Planctomycetota bacterium]
MNIRINLLPPELRSQGVEPRLKLILGASALGLVAVALSCWLYLVYATNGLGDGLVAKRGELTALRQEAMRVDSLLDEISDY